MGCVEDNCKEHKFVLFYIESSKGLDAPEIVIQWGLGIPRLLGRQVAGPL
jgi:hypothetical protein